MVLGGFWSCLVMPCPKKHPYDPNPEWDTHSIKGRPAPGSTSAMASMATTGSFGKSEIYQARQCMDSSFFFSICCLRTWQVQAHLQYWSKDSSVWFSSNCGTGGTGRIFAAFASVCSSIAPNRAARGTMQCGQFDKSNVGSHSSGLATAGKKIKKSKDHRLVLEMGNTVLFGWRVRAQLLWYVM